MYLNYLFVSFIVLYKKVINKGDKVNIVLRGIYTVQGGTRPLVLLDGVEIPFENLTIIDPSQIDRVKIVQGAASASLYDAQGEVDNWQ